MLTFIRWLHFKLNKWYSWPVVLGLCSLIAFVIHDLWIPRTLVFFGCVTIYFIVKWASKKALEYLYASEAKGLVVYNTEKKWLISYDETKERFIWEATIRLELKNLGTIEIDNMPYFEVSSHYKQEDVTFDIFQKSVSNTRVKVGGIIEDYTNSMCSSECEPRKVYIIRRYYKLPQPLRPGGLTEVWAEIKFTHAKNLFKECGVIGTNIRYVRLRESIELNVAMPLRINVFNCIVLSPMGVSDTKIAEQQSYPVLDVSGRLLSWVIQNPLPDYNYLINFTVEKN